jgi:hypothetical protein
MAVGRITAEAQWWSPPGTDRTTAVLDIGQAVRITCGSPVTGSIETGRSSGDGDITSYADIDHAIKERRLSSPRGQSRVRDSLTF